MAVAQQAANGETVERIVTQPGTVNMLAFFRGRKRKVGCVTLVLACVFAAGWVRSSARTDTVRFARRGWHAMSSKNGALSWVENNLMPALNEPAERKSNKETPGLPAKWRISPDNPFGNLTIGDWKTKWRFDAFGFHFGTLIHAKGGFHIRFRFVPFWSIVIPLTLFSAWLLLSNPLLKVSE